MTRHAVNLDPILSRRQFVQGAAASVAAGAMRQAQARSAPSSSKGVVVGAHPWVYAAKQPRFDIYPILDRIFADVAYAGMDGIELMHTALHPSDSVERIKALSDQHHLPVIGMSYGGAMWDRSKHPALLEETRLIIPRLGELGGEDAGDFRRPRPPAQDQGAARRPGGAAPQADRPVPCQRHRLEPS